MPRSRQTVLTRISVIAVTLIVIGAFALPALASGATYEITVTADVTATGGSVANTATVATPAGTSDPTPGNNSATDTDTVTAAAPTADLAIGKSDGASSVTAGGSSSA